MFVWVFVCLVWFFAYFICVFSFFIKFQSSCVELYKLRSVVFMQVLWEVDSVQSEAGLGLSTIAISVHHSYTFSSSGLVLPKHGGLGNGRCFSVLALHPQLSVTLHGRVTSGYLFTL